MPKAITGKNIVVTSEYYRNESTDYVCSNMSYEHGENEFYENYYGS